MDFHQKRIKKEISELEQAIRAGKHWEVVHNKKATKMLKNKMQFYMHEYKKPSINFHRYAKFEILNNI